MIKCPFCLKRDLFEFRVNYYAACSCEYKMFAQFNGPKMIYWDVKAQNDFWIQSELSSNKTTMCSFGEEIVSIASYFNMPNSIEELNLMIDSLLKLSIY